MIIAILSAGAMLASGTVASNPAPVSPLVVNGKHQKIEDPGITRNTVVCQSEQVLGTLFPKKVCATKEEMSERRTSGQEELRRIQAYQPLIIDSGKMPGT